VVSSLSSFLFSCSFLFLLVPSFFSRPPRLLRNGGEKMSDSHRIGDDFRNENIVCVVVGEIECFRCVTCQKVFYEEIYALNHLKMVHNLFPPAEGTSKLKVQS
jgi:hypothetical protein